VREYNTLSWYFPDITFDDLAKDYDPEDFSDYDMLYCFFASKDKRIYNSER